MQKDLWYLVLNGKAAGNDAVRDAVRTLRQSGIDLSVRVTWEAGDARRYVEEAIAAGAGTIVAGGGDGSLNEVATALCRNEATADALPTLALLPLGTANDFATATGIPTEPDRALQLAVSVSAVAMDLLRIEADDGIHWCANLASGGFGTEVTVETSEGLKKRLGGLAYVLTGLSKLGDIEPVRADFDGEGFQWRGGFIAVGIGNGRQAGGGQQLCPQALLDDGLLDLTLLLPPDAGMAEMLKTALAGGKEALADELAVRARLPWLEIVAREKPLTLNLDGEPVASRRFRIDCVPARLRMHLPPACSLLGHASP